MTQKKCIWCNRQGDSLTEIEVALIKSWRGRLAPDKFSVCSPECRQKFLDYVELYNRYGRVVGAVNLLLVIALLLSVLVAPFVYPALFAPKIWGGLLMLLGLLMLISPVVGGLEPAVPFPIARMPGFRHEGVRRLYWRVRIIGVVVLLIGLAVFLWWPWE